ncbi:SPX domain-containing membrane protein [Musa troglodytarum]|uniref:SPX domain-containing membrane protein n=1 Tax=Musa troglodytarum TaxID=320322 RepID=A0A9E7FA31_9LILI|nr:SPX domain-containing membrane protein [Musa troglodytarum]
MGALLLLQGSECPWQRPRQRGSSVASEAACLLSSVTGNEPPRRRLRQQPVHDNEVKHLSPDVDAGGVEDKALESGLVHPLLQSSEHKQHEDGDEECNDREKASEDSHKPATSVASAYGLLTPSVKADLVRI